MPETDALINAAKTGNTFVLVGQVVFKSDVTVTLSTATLSISALSYVVLSM